MGQRAGGGGKEDRREEGYESGELSMSVVGGAVGQGRVSTQEEGRAAYKAISVSACREDPHQVKTFPPASPPPSHRKKQDL